MSFSALVKRMCLGMRIRSQSLLEEEMKGARSPASPLRDTAPGQCKHFVRAKVDAYENRIPAHYSKGHTFWVGQRGCGYAKQRRDEENGNQHPVVPHPHWQGIPFAINLQWRMLKKAGMRFPASLSILVGIKNTHDSRIPKLTIARGVRFG